MNFQYIKLQINSGNRSEYFDEINWTTSNFKSENIDTRRYNLSSFKIEDDTSSRGSICQDQNSTKNFESLENDNYTNNEWEDHSENKEGFTSNKYCYQTSANNTSNMCNLDNEKICLCVSPLFLSNINNISASPTDFLIEDSHFIEGDFDNNIDYMTNVFYSYKQNIEKKKGSYISPEELKIFYDCPTFEEYHYCNEWSNTMFSKRKKSKVFHISINHNIIW